MADVQPGWTLPDLPSSVRWCKSRNTEGIRGIIAPLGEHANDRTAAFRGVKAYIDGIRAVEASQLDASVAIKLSAIGAIFDPLHCRENSLALIREAEKRHVAVEIDMEGKGLADQTVGLAISSAQQGYSLTLALQAYLDRTSKDLENVISHGIGIRLVKGAYHGDTENFMEIRDRFHALVMKGLSMGGTVSAATHDQSIIDWVRNEHQDEKNRLELGFLMGMSEQTKMDLVGEGWTVSEYIPYGEEAGAYTARREYYLRHLESLGMAPAP